MNFLVLPACEDSNFLSVLKLVKDGLNLICIIVPIILIIMASIDLLKIVMGNGEVKKPISALIRRIISCCAIFFIPIVVELFIEMLGVVSVNSITVCVNNANTETIEYYRGKEEEKNALMEKANLLERENNEKERNKLADLREEARKENEKEAEEAEKNKNNGGSDYSLGETIEGSATSASQVVWDKTNVSRVSNLTVSQLIAILNSHGGKAVRYVPYAADLITGENKYGVNVFFLLGVSALESGWIDESHDMISKCNNLGGVCATQSRPSNGCFKNSNCEFAYYSSKGEFIDSHARLLGQSYLNPNGSYYEGTTASAVVIHYCPGCSSWPGTVNAIGDQLYAHVSKVM